MRSNIEFLEFNCSRNGVQRSQISRRLLVKFNDTIARYRDFPILVYAITVFKACLNWYGKLKYIILR